MRHLITLFFTASCLTALGQDTNYIFDSQLEDQGWELLLERQGQQYWLLNQDYTWEESMAICTSLGGYLYWPNSSAEHFDVWSQVEHDVDSVQYWTGIHQDFELVDCNSGGGWVGPDGTPQQYFDWYPGEPSNYNGGESVVQFEWGPVGIQWNDAPGQQCDSLNQDPYNIRESRIIMERSKEAGCTDSTAWNYDETVTIDDGSCLLGSSFCGPGTIWDAALQMCVGDGSGDINLDGCVQLNDLLDLLSAYGNCGAEESPWQCGDTLEYQGYDYETVQIGEQCWFAENLRAENYRNGEGIPNLIDDTGWNQATEGATTIYGAGISPCGCSSPIIDCCNDSLSFSAFGRLYNGYSITNESEVCPQSWHVPSDDDWIDLELFLGIDTSTVNSWGWRGGSSSMATQMKSTGDWYGWDGSNTSGFNGRPGGRRKETGEFTNGGNYGQWWSSTFFEETLIWRGLLHNNSGICRYDASYMTRGKSIRCIKDAE